MKNFDLKKFLTENKMTSNSRMLNEDGDVKEAFDTEFRDIRDRAYRDAERAVHNTDDSVINSDYYGHYVKEYLKTYESLTSQLIHQQSTDHAKIKNWYLKTNPRADELSQEEEEAGLKAHFEEWNAVKDQYNSIEDYFEDVEREGDWY